MTLFKDVCDVIEPFVMSEKSDYKEIIENEYILMLDYHVKYDHPLIKETNDYKNAFIYINDGTYIDNTYIIKVKNENVTTEYVYNYILYMGLSSEILNYQISNGSSINDSEIKILSLEKQKLINDFINKTRTVDNLVYNEELINTTFNMMKQFIKSYINPDTTYSMLQNISKPYYGDEYDNKIANGKYKIITIYGNNNKHKQFNRNGFNIVICQFYNNHKYSELGGISDHILLKYGPFFMSDSGFTLNITNTNILPEFLGLYLFFFNKEFDYDSNFGWRDIRDVKIPIFSNEVQSKLIKVLSRSYRLLKNIRPCERLIREYFNNIS